MVEFLYPGYLWALPAIVIPVAIHLLSRRRYRRVPWAAMQHLLQAQRQASLRIRWHNFLVLLLRSAVVLLLVLLFARPQPTRPLPGLAGGLPKTVLILLDDSASMAERGGGTSAFERAKDFTLTLVERLAGSGAAVAGHAASAEESFFSAAPVRTGDVPRLKERLAGLRTTATVFEPAPRCASLGADAAALGGEPVFYVLTDLRAADWGADRLDPDAARGLAVLQEYGPVILVDVGRGDGINFALTGVRGGDRPAYARAAAALRIILQNESAGALGPSRLAVRLHGPAAGQLPPVQAPAVPPGEEREVALGVFLDRPGHHALEATLGADDAFPPDNRLFIAVQAVDRLPVLVVEGGAEPGSSGGPAYYVRAALQPAPSAAGGVHVQLQRAMSAVPGDLARYAAVFLCDVPSPLAWHEALRGYVDGGGRLVVFLGKRARAEAWNETLLSESGGLLPCRLDEEAQAGLDASFHLSVTDFSHPLLTPFTDWQTLLGLPEFTAFHQVQPLGMTRVLARFDDPESSPAMLVAGTGNGLTIVFATSADDSWSDWPRSEAGRVTYLGLMQWLVEQGAPAVRPEFNLLGGGRIEFPLDPAQFRPEATLLPPQMPDGAKREPARVRAQPHAKGKGLWFTSEPLRHEGIYELQLTDLAGQPSSAFFAVNTPPTERLLQQARPETVQGAEASPGRLQVLRYGGRPVASGLRAPATPAVYWAALAGIIICLLVAESFLAYVFGNPAAPASADGRRGRSTR
ncbi:MAG: BatA domain-containing protein [Planctomycetota bacterium]|jgi:hypothetical protein